MERKELPIDVAKWWKELPPAEREKILDERVPSIDFFTYIVDYHSNNIKKIITLDNFLK